MLEIRAEFLNKRQMLSYQVPVVICKLLEFSNIMSDLLLKICLFILPPGTVLTSSYLTVHPISLLNQVYIVNLWSVSVGLKAYRSR